MNTALTGLTTRLPALLKLESNESPSVTSYQLSVISKQLGREGTRWGVVG